MFGFLSASLAALYLLDRAWKALAVAHFFRRHQPPAPENWPGLSLIQPVTAGPNDLRAVLTLRAQNPYPGWMEQIIVCDAADSVSQALIRELATAFPAWQPRLVFVDTPGGVAPKTLKQLAGLEGAAGDIICFVDDDILLRPETLAALVRHLQSGVGATFGLACYTNHQTLWGGLMSAFVNANALLTYVPFTYLAQPYTITGHVYALRRADFEAIGGLSGMQRRLDDDHELARRVRHAGLRNCQTPAIYDVDNELPSLAAFLAQMKRWFVFPRQMMLPGTSFGQQFLTLGTSLPNLLPGLLLLLALFQPVAWSALAVCLVAFYLVYFWEERAILKRAAPAWAWPLLLLVALVLPFQALFLLFSDNTVLWRGQRYRVRRGGEYEIIR
jgi:ceramide glucosyltransferase